MRHVAAVCVVAVVLGGCFPSDPGWSLEVVNNSSQTVLVAVDDGVRTVVYAPAGTAGYAYGTLGVGRRGVTVLEIDCTVRTRIETGDMGAFSLVIDAGGNASVAAVERPGDTQRLRTLSGICGGDESCVGAETPWPSDVPSRPPMEWCEGN